MLPLQKRKLKKGLRDEIINKVKDFYGNNEISWQGPGQKMLLP